MAILLHKVFALALLAEYSSANVATPMTKVVELLDNVRKQLEKDSAEEAKLFSEYTNWCDKEKADSFKTIKRTKKEISELEALLESEEAFRKKKGTEIEKLIGELAGNEKDLKDATVIRERDRKLFLEEERTLIESIDALERSLEVLAKKAPAAALPQTGSASLVKVASTLRRLAERSPDFALNAGQQSILDSFFQNAVAAQRGRMGSSLDFLQLDSEDAEDGDYESKAGGITETLQKILVKTKAEKDEQATKEQDAQMNFKKLTIPLKQEIEDQTKALTEKKRQVAKSEQVSAEKTAELAAANELLQVTEKHLEDVKNQCIQKAIEWHARTDKRSDEITAIQMALQILTSAAAKRMQSKQTVGSEVHLTQLSFLQTKQTTSRVARALSKLRASGLPSMSLLAVRAHHRLISTSSADPFADVKRMIQDMLVKLQKEMAEEAKKKEWCDQEMGKSAKSKHAKEKEVDKLSSRIEQLEADLEELEDSLEKLSADTAEAAAAVSTATKIRGEEKMSNLKAIKEYQDAQTLLSNAMTVLKDFYEKDSFVQTSSDAAPPDDSFSSEYESDAAGGGSGIIGILEIAIADFAKLEQDTTTGESSAAHEYEEFMKETQIQQAVWAKDLEYKNTAKVKTGGDLQRAKSDLEGYQKELDAVNLYIEKLKPQCTTQPDSYEERKKRRDAELASLREALSILNGEAIA
jgi:hypothetical protein